jgi:hypothetical protein
MVWPSAINPLPTASLSIGAQGRCEFSFGQMQSSIIIARLDFLQASTSREPGTSMARLKSNQPHPTNLISISQPISQTH